MGLIVAGLLWPEDSTPISKSSSEKPQNHTLTQSAPPSEPSSQTQTVPTGPQSSNERPQNQTVAKGSQSGLVPMKEKNNRDPSSNGTAAAQVPSSHMQELYCLDIGKEERPRTSPGRLAELDLIETLKEVLNTVALPGITGYRLVEDAESNRVEPEDMAQKRIEDSSMYLDWLFLDLYQDHKLTWRISITVMTQNKGCNKETVFHPDFWVALVQVSIPMHPESHAFLSQAELNSARPFFENMVHRLYVPLVNRLQQTCFEQSEPYRLTLDHLQWYVTEGSKRPAPSFPDRSPEEARLEQRVEDFRTSFVTLPMNSSNLTSGPCTWIPGSLPEGHFPTNPDP